MRPIEHLGGRALVYHGAALDPKLHEQLWAECTPLLQMTPLYPAQTGLARIVRNHDQMRATAGDPDIVFRYKDRARPLHRWTPGMLVLREVVQRLRGWMPNKATINRYTPAGLIVPHRDKDYITGMAPAHEFVVFSFGATRTMLFIRTDDGATRTHDVTPIPLPAGSMLVVSGPLDHTHLHGIDPEPKVAGDRLSIAFKAHITQE